jgi:hypothetical protein
MAVEDSSLVLEVSRVCCGSRSQVEGRLMTNGRPAPLKSGSNVNAYTIVVSDSGAKPFHVFELHLEVESAVEGSICGLDGFAQDGAGKTEFTEPANPEIARLRLAKSVFMGSTCRASLDSLEWKKQP